MTTEFDPATSDAVGEFLLTVADDEFVVGHRYTDWVAVGPTLEEDNTLASIAQDELGHARLWYEYLLEADYSLPLADASDPVIEDLSINRPADTRANSTLVEQSQTDFAHAVAVNFLYDEYEGLLLEALADGAVTAIADRASMARNEEPFHREHADRWLDRLTATEEGRERLDAAFDRSLELSQDLFSFDDAVAEAAFDAGVIDTPLPDLREEWCATVSVRLDELPIDASIMYEDFSADAPQPNGRAREHTDELDDMIDQMHADNLAGSHPVTR